MGITIVKKKVTTPVTKKFVGKKASVKTSTKKPDVHTGGHTEFEVETIPASEIVGLKAMVDSGGVLKVNEQKAGKIHREAKKSLDDVLDDIRLVVNEVELPKDETLTIGGDKYVGVVGHVPKARVVIDTQRVCEILEGIEENLAFKLMKFALSDLDKYLTPVQLEEVLKTIQEGKRPVTFSPL